MGTLCEDVFTFMTLSRGVFRRMRNVSNRSCTEKNAYFMFHNFFSESHAVYEIMLKYVMEPEWLQMTVWLHSGCWISEATLMQAHCPHPVSLSLTHTQFIAFPLQQWFRE